MVRLYMTSYVKMNASIVGGHLVIARCRVHEPDDGKGHLTFGNKAGEV